MVGAMRFPIYVAVAGPDEDVVAVIRAALGADPAEAALAVGQAIGEISDDLKRHVFDLGLDPETIEIERDAA